MIVIEVETPNVQQREGISAKGTPYKIRNQTCYAHTFDVETGELKKYPTEIKIRLQEDQLPYAAGFYMTSLRSTPTVTTHSPLIRCLSLRPTTPHWSTSAPPACLKTRKPPK
ncbi:G5P family DNA-binding protein [Paludibacterium denitrificans]|uniref:Single-stranded DNA-binding protein n=1 Tax=Paludibacterium denitrificans TaxID=2675226 RepID=A0A844GGW7_9NEIS|nr:G5P family DNA-binding protein [Paludibacterium denitrificans]MTD33914.1 hypothetical protein [Paludibacterium denitrificans]